jgi:hypothetical protein
MRSIATRALCLPYKGTVGRNALVSGSFLGYACGTTLMLPSGRPRGGRSLIDIPLTQKAWTMYRCGMVTRKSPSMRVSVLGPGCRAEQEAKLPTRLVKMGRSPPGFNPDRLN